MATEPDDWLDYPCVVSSAELRYGQWYGLAIYVPSTDSFNFIEAQAVADEEIGACLRAQMRLNARIKVTKKPPSDEPGGEDDDEEE